MTQATEAPLLTEADLTLFLDSLGEHCLPCEAPHDKNGNPCSEDVTHRERITCCGIVRNVCTSEALDLDAWKRAGLGCYYCNRPLAKCWTINPI